MPLIDSITFYPARKIITMDESRPYATWLAVSAGRIVAVGDEADMAPWRQGREVKVNRCFEDCVLMPGLIDNHIHPFLGALLQPMAILAPEPWRREDLSLSPALRDKESYEIALCAAVQAASPDEPFLTWGYQPSLHGHFDRQMLDSWFPGRSVILWHRSFHETVLSSTALEKLGLQDSGPHPHVNWAKGHYFETGLGLVLGKLMPHFMRPAWYGRGLRSTVRLAQMGGITTVADMAFGLIAPEFEAKNLDQVLNQEQAPLRVVNVFDVRNYASRAKGHSLGPPNQMLDFAAGLAVIESQRGAAVEGNGRDLWVSKGSLQNRIWYAKAVKLFADGAMFSQLMRLRFPGYTDGHEGAWLMTPEVLKAGMQAAWQAGYTVHVHVNGDEGMDAVLDALESAQARTPRWDHRMHVHHVGFHSQAQSTRLAALGAHASVNPYYLHALSDDYAGLGLGPERAEQICRAGSLKRAGMRVSLHSDYMMAPPEPFALAWCAAARISRSGKRMAPEERLTLHEALRGITIDAAFTLRLEDEIGSLVAGKRADLCVLLDDPESLGADRLNLVRVAGTMFEGQVHMLDKPVGSSLAASALRFQSGEEADLSVTQIDKAIFTQVEETWQRWKPVACSSAQDRCAITRRWGQWLQQAWLGNVSRTSEAS